MLTKLISNNKDIQHLSLNNCNISVQEMLHFSHILQGVYTLQYLDISYISLDDILIVENITHVIFCNTQLKYLQLAGCNLSACHSAQIIAAIKHCCNLVLLNLSYNHIVNVTELLNTGCIQYLYLKNCFLDSSKLHNIVAEFKH